MYILRLKSNKKRFPNLVWLILSIFAAISMWYLGNYCSEYTEKTTIHKGTVMFRYEDKYIKDKDSIKEQKLLVKFDDLDKVRSIDYDPELCKISGNKIVMFLSRSYVGEAGFQSFLGAITVLAFIASVVSIIIYLWKNIEHIFKDYKWVSTKLIKIRKEIDPYGEEDWDD